MKKVQKVLISALCLALGACALTACGDGDETTGDGNVKVSFYNGDTLVATETVKKGESVGRPETSPTKEGYEFVRWCATPTYSQAFDFDKKLSEDTSVYAGFRSNAADSHVYYLAGASNTSTLFAESGNYKEYKGETAENLPASVTLVKDANQGNKYTFTADFYVGDKFQILDTEHGWSDYQIGYGYIDPQQYSTETTSAFYNGGGLSGANKTSDSIVGQSGNYTITLITDADGKLTEWSYLRNGDAAEVASSYLEYYIKGATITGWADLYNDATKMIKSGDKYKLEVYLKANEEFMFSTLAVNDGVSSTGTTYIRSTNLDDTSKELFNETAGKNMIAKTAGTYTFLYDEEEETLSVTLNAEKVPAAYDYYLDLAKGGTGWGGYQENAEDTKLTGEDGKYTISAVELDAGDQFVIRSYAEGTEELKWDNKGDDYNFKYYKPDGTAFTANNPDGGDYNVKVVTPGTYDITFDSYAKMIVIKIHNDSPDVYDIYLKGLQVVNSEETESTWDHGFADEWKMTINADNTAYEMTVTVKNGAEFCLARYNKGASTGNGDTVKATDLNEAGEDNLNESFTSSNNFKYEGEEDVTVKIVYTIATGKVDFIEVTAE